MMTTSRGVTDTKIYDRDGVVERYGVPPELVTDLIGLKGDTSDNIPGVPGIGDKTAAQLLQEYGVLEAVLANIDKISGAKRKENLTNHAEDARISKQLATHHRHRRRARPRRADVRSSGSQPPARGGAEFELRVIMQRLEEEFAEDVPDAPSRRCSIDRGGRGDSGGPRRGSGRPAIAGGTWAGNDGERVVAGELRRFRGARRAALGEQPLIGHDPKSLGGGARTGLAGRRARRHPRPRPRHDGRRLPARPGPPHL